MTDEWNPNVELAASPNDPGCEAVFRQQHEYVDALLASAEPSQVYPGVESHLLSCPACREDYLGLIDAAERFAPAHPADSFADPDP